MANGTAITLTECVANGKVTQPAVDTLDTGTDLAGDSPAALRASLGDLILTAALAENGVEVFGPFDSARFGQSDGRLDFTFTPSDGTIGVAIRAFRLPKAV